MFKRLFLYIILSFSIISVINAAQSQFVGCLYTIDANQINIAWNPVPNADFYEVQLIFIDKNTNLAIKTTTTPNFSFQRPKAGHFKIRVRSCNSSGKSVWSESSNSTKSKVDGSDMGWIIYWKLASPGVIIE